MPLLKPPERAFCEAVSRLVYCNPFLPERIAGEQEALGPEFTQPGADWNVHAEQMATAPNVLLVRERVEQLATELRRRLDQNVKLSQRERELYEDLALFALYHRYNEDFDDAVRTMVG